MKVSTRMSLIFSTACVILFSTVTITQRMVQANAENTLPPKQTQHDDPQVTVSWQTPKAYQGKVVAYGASQAHYALTLTAQVAGQVTDISSQFETGNTFKQGQWLAKLENSAYLADVAAAKQTLASAKVSLLEEQRQAQMALEEWQSSDLDGEPDSALVLRQPQIEAAQSLVDEAQSNLKSASKNVNYSTIHAPFDALIIERNIAPGSYVQIGTEIAQLYSTDWVEVKVALSANDWKNLPDPLAVEQSDWPVTLYSVESHKSWSGIILRSEQHLDDDTRQRSLIVAVKQPFSQTPALYPGTFLRVEIAGKQVDQLWQLPSSALSQRGEIWYVKSDNTLDKFSSTPRFTDESHLYVSVPEQFADQAVAVVSHPLNSYLTGMKVVPVETNHE